MHACTVAEMVMNTSVPDVTRFDTKSRLSLGRRIQQTWDDGGSAFAMLVATARVDLRPSGGTSTDGLQAWLACDHASLAASSCRWQRERRRYWEVANCASARQRACATRVSARHRGAGLWWKIDNVATTSRRGQRPD